MRTYAYMLERLGEHPLLIGVIDPPLAHDFSRELKMARAFESGGADLIFVGGSIGSSREVLDEMLEEIKREVSIPVVLFPGNAEMLSRHADAVLFMSLLNSEDVYWITGAAVLGAPLVKKLGLEPIPTAYLIVEPGEAVGFVGRARALRRNKPEIAAAYALAGQYTGKKLVILEAGSGASEHVPLEVVAAVSRAVSIPVIVGGGIKSPEEAGKIVRAGASGVQIGSIIEKSEEPEKVVEAFRREIDENAVDRP